MSPFTSVTSTITSSTPQASSSSAPSFQFAAVPEMYTCGVAEIQWTYSGPSAPMSFNITNVNVAQQAPLSTNTRSTTTTTSAATSQTVAAVIIQRDTISGRQYSGYGGSYLPQIDEQLATQLDPLVGIWRWSSANVPQGWYRMLASVQGVLQVSSSSFFVQNGTDVSCVLQFYPASSSSTIVVQVPTVTAKATASSKATSSHTGAVVGGTIAGAAAVILAIGAMIAFARRRRRRRQKHDESPHMQRNAVDPSFSNALIVRAGGAVTPFDTQMDQQRVVPLNTASPSPPPPPLLQSSSSSSPPHIPIGLSGKELARLRSGAGLLPTEPPTAAAAAGSSPSDSQPASLPIVVTAEEPPQSEVEYLRREVQQLRAQQIRAEGFEAPPSYVSPSRSG